MLGCDIHIYVEKQELDGSWEPLSGPSYEKQYLYGRLVNETSEQSIMQLKKSISQNSSYSFEWFYSNRNYKLFSFLADVRNYDDEIKPICKPRGLPADISPYVRGQFRNWESDAHSTSYFMISELIDYDWKEYKQSFDQFISKIKILSKKEDPNRTRIVFWFDN